MFVNPGLVSLTSNLSSSFYWKACLHIKEQACCFRIYLIKVFHPGDEKEGK